ncbi:L-aminoadipate-semialdehyde dehydrogenase [Mycena sanguinolenta]|uniref:L-aminoadipate-semialdehyde dehydrogenase n=1 Tax=Mycena sanguinolenta TaxID=230812 RepID=A0A8H7D4H6_9AGAR|nr:L-aminoadipate-semialdehyde dehydrogenase [Mycena sanguinolenta]
MDLKDKFPNELWLEVFSYLPPAARRNLSSTHRSVYDLARPLGFTEFTLYSYPYWLRPQKVQLDEAMERLRFWALPRIAPHVRSCTISQKRDLWQKSDTKALQDDEHVLLNAFFEHLPHFTGLERLDTDQIRLELTQPGIGNLCRLPALQELRLSTIVVLSRSEVQDFPNVHTLQIDGLANFTYDTVTIFNKFPNLRSFKFYGRVLRNLSPAQESSLFPVLQEYTGDYQNLHIFGKRATLTHIALVHGFLFPDLLFELQGITILPNITFLAVPFLTSVQAVFAKAEIETLITLFPNLTDLQLTLMPTENNGHGLTRQMTSFLEMLSSHLPSTLHSLSLRWDFSEYDSSDPEIDDVLAPPPPNDIPDFAVVQAWLMAKCPALTYILIDGCHFLFLQRWQRSSAWEAVAHSFNDAEVIREQLGKTY